jgi:hypothetical protein
MRIHFFLRGKRLRTLSAVEKIYNELRRDFLVSGGFEAASKMLLFSDRALVSKVYTLAIELLWTVEHNELDWDLHIWPWIQKAKGRSLADFYGDWPNHCRKRGQLGRTIASKCLFAGIGKNLLEAATQDRAQFHRDSSELREAMLRFWNCRIFWER